MITFEKATLKHVDTIFNWLAEPHIMEFWDNSIEHREDILNFIHGRKQIYFYGTFQYWIGTLDKVPYCLLVSDRIAEDQGLTEAQKKYMPSKGHAIALDFGIGQREYIGKGLAAKTLMAFMEFYRTDIDTQAKIFFIDPDQKNHRAQHVYKKAGFEVIEENKVTDGAFKESVSLMMVRQV